MSVEQNGSLNEGAVNAIPLGHEVHFNNERVVIEENPDNMILGLNVRERDDVFINELAISIYTQGQIQECTGDTLPDRTIRVWAGQHRYWAVQLINKSIREHNTDNPHDLIEERKLRVRVYQKEFTEDEILEIQIAENLHKNMRPEEEAAVIEKIYYLYQQKFEEKASVSAFARRVGLGEAKVGNALKFVSLHTKVKDLVSVDALLYSVATNIARLPKERQLPIAAYIITRNLTRNQTDNVIRMEMESDKILSIFNKELQRSLEKENLRLGLRTAADRAARDAAGYFRRVIYLLDVLDDPTRLTITDTIRDILAQFIKASDVFQKELSNKSPKMHSKIVRRVEELITE